MTFFCSPERCQGVQLLPQVSFYPYGWFDSQDLFNQETEEFWRETFADSFTVHLYQSSRSFKIRNVMKRRFYGAKAPALMFLAEDHCPLSFHSEKVF